MKAKPKSIALLFIKDILYVRLHPNQIWEVQKCSNGECEVSHKEITLVLKESEFNDYFKIY